MPGHKVSCLQACLITTSIGQPAMGDGGCRYPQGARLKPRKSIRAGGPGLFLQMAICLCITRSKGRHDSTDPEGQCVLLGRTSRKAPFGPRKNFESKILAYLCGAFGVKKSRTTPYHPMGDGLVERMNRSLLNLLRSYTEKEGDWEENLQLLLYMYRSTKHTTTGLSPYEVLFGVNPPSLNVPRLPGTVVPEPSEYSANLRSKILELREMADANIVESAERLRLSYPGEGTCTKLQIGLIFYQPKPANCFFSSLSAFLFKY